MKVSWKRALQKMNECGVLQTVEKKCVLCGNDMRYSDEVEVQFFARFDVSFYAVVHKLCQIRENESEH